MTDQHEAPQQPARYHRNSEPQPAAQTCQRVGGAGDHGQIGDEWPGVGSLRRHQKGHGERASEAEASERRSMQRGRQHGGNTDEAE